MRRRLSGTLALTCSAALLLSGCSKPENKDGSKDTGSKPPAGGPAAAKSGSPEDLNYILKKYVKDGMVDYASLKKSSEDTARLDAFMKWQGEAKVSEMSKKAQEAFYINAYNSCCMKSVLDHYPVHCPLDIPGFFDKIKFKVGGEDLTVNDVEYNRLIPNYKDMRSHFAIVCADRGCLPLRPEVWTEANLDKNLEETMHAFVTKDKDAKAATQWKVVKDEKTGEVELWVSKEFEWYGKDFTSDPNRPASKPELFVKPWVDDETKKLLDSGSYKLRIVEWGWTLNETMPPVTPPSATAAKTGSPDDFDAILKKYVKDGLVDYGGLRKNADDMARFDAFMKWQAEAKVSEMSPK
ncbi:DUF547 domain-containing protein, partial [bacterium]|nr:DUF547 domain-containing protein [bacterium]